MTGPDDFEHFVCAAEPRLRRALVSRLGAERGRDATAESLAYAWEHWEQVRTMANPVAYLFRVGQSRTRERKRPPVFPPPPTSAPEVSPELPAALAQLSPSQRMAVVLVHGYGWTTAEVAELEGVAPTTVQTHVRRGLEKLRRSVKEDAGG